jgi:hypothetical protein
MHMRVAAVVGDVGHHVMINLRRHRRRHRLPAADRAGRDGRLADAAVV